MRLTFIWGATPWMKADDSGIWFARRTPSGPATLHIRRQGQRLLVDAWGPGAEDLLPLAGPLVGLEDAGMGSLPIAHPRLARLLGRTRGARMGRTGRLTARLIAVSIGQKVTGKGSIASTYRLARAWGEPAPGPHPGIGLFPTAATLAKHRYHDYHPFGIERRRADLIRRIAIHASALDRALALPAREARAHLRALPGIGPWTAAIAIGTSHGDPDSLPLNDVHLPNWVAWNLERRPRASDAEMVQILAPYRGQRGRIARLVKVAGEPAPRFGPRMAVKDIDGW